MQPKVYAKYPFLTHSSQFVKKQDVSLEDLLYSDVYERARDRAYAKILESVMREEALKLEFSSAESLEAISSLDDRTKIVNEVLSYVIARIIISCINDPFLIQWYAHHQAFLAFNYLQEEDPDILTLVSEDLGLTYEELDEETVSLAFTDYLISTKGLKSPDWKLVNRDLKKGRIILQTRNLKRLLLEVIRSKVISEFPRPVTKEIMSYFKDWSKRIKNEIAAKKAEYEQFNSADVDLELFPPCLKSLIGRIGAGENISHEGRFAIVAFANTIGMTKDDIFKVFGSAPDFDQSKSQYQVEHIIGEISGTEYTPPECSTMKTYGNCIDADNLCKKEWMTHPLKYYKNKLKWKKKEDEKRAALEKQKEAAKKKSEANAAEEEGGDKTAPEDNEEKGEPGETKHTAEEE